MLDLEAGAREHAAQRGRGEAGVHVAVGGRDVGVVVRVERDGDERPPGPQHAGGLGQGRAPAARGA